MILLYKHKKKYSFFLFLLCLFHLNLYSSNPNNPSEERSRIPEKARISTLFTQGIMGYLSQKYNLANKVVYEINLEEYLPSEFIEKIGGKIPITQQKVLSLALTSLILPQLGIASLTSMGVISGAHGLGYHYTGRLLGRPYGYIAEKIGKTPIVRTLAYGKPHWLLEYPVALPRWVIKSFVQGSIQGSLYGSMLRATRPFHPSNIFSKIRELRNKKPHEKTTGKSTTTQTKQ